MLYFPASHPTQNAPSDELYEPAEQVTGEGFDVGYRVGATEGSTVVGCDVGCGVGMPGAYDGASVNGYRVGFGDGRTGAVGLGEGCADALFGIEDISNNTKKAKNNVRFICIVACCE